MLNALETKVVVPQHRTEKNATFTQQVINRFYELNELYNCTLNKVHHLLYATDISSNDRLTFRNAMKQDDKLAFVDATEKEISDHEKGGHWSPFLWHLQKLVCHPVSFHFETLSCRWNLFRLNKGGDEPL